MSDELRDRIAVLRALAEKATPGPWEFGCGLDAWSITTVADDSDDELHVATTPGGADGEYIAAANPAAILALLDEVAGALRLKAAVDATRFGDFEVFMPDGEQIIDADTLLRRLRAVADGGEQ